MIQFTAYHGTCSIHKASIEQHGFSPEKVKRRDDHWLGQGVYFFSDQNIATWWAKDQASKDWNKGSFPVVYQCEISTDESAYFDLDVYSNLDYFFNYAIQLKRDIDESPDLTNKPIFTDDSFRAILFDYFKRANNIDVIVYTFSKPLASYTQKRRGNDKSLVLTLSDILGLSFHERQICVSNRACMGHPTPLLDINEVI